MEAAPSCGYGGGDTVDDSLPFEEKPRPESVGLPPLQMDDALFMNSAITNTS